MAFRIDDSLLQEIRDRSNIVTVVGEYVRLRKAGNHHKGLCPFHGEKTPSFTVHEDRQFFYCFGCQAGGDVISFLRELNGYSFMEAVRVLADRAGIVLPEPSPADRGSFMSSGPARSSYYQVGGDTQRFFVESISAMQGQSARNYLDQRGVERDAAQTFGLGFAPSGWDGLASYLNQQRHDPSLAEALGLISERKGRGGHYDRFRNRLMFPIRNVSGQVIGFSGRDLSGEKEAAKYINSPESPVFTKGRTLYGLYEARKAMRAKGRAILVEGNLDVVRMSQAGFEETVAPLGTALTEAQCTLLKRFVDRVVLLFDGDKAGRAANLKGIGTALAAGLQVTSVLLPEGLDPDTFLQDNPAEAMTEQIDGASSGWDVLVKTTIQQTGAFDDPAGPLRAADHLAPVLQAISDRRARTLYQRDLAQRLDLDPGTLNNALRSSSRASTRPRTEEPVMPVRSEPVTSSPAAVREQQLVTLMLSSPESCSLYTAHDVSELITHSELEAIAEALVESWENEETIDITRLLEDLATPQLRASIYQMLATSPEIQEWSTPFEQLENGLRVDKLHRDVKLLKRKLNEAAMRGDELEVDRLGTRAVELDKEIENLRATRGPKWQN